jgi:3'(2'), 5'-bisphosphate nucleotidase
MINFDIEEIKKIARDAGKEILKYYPKDYGVIEKADGSPVTVADLASEEIIQAELKKYSFPIISEEAENENLNLRKLDYVWLVDPLDGTSDFIEKTGEFAVLIGLLKNNEPFLGIIYQPVTEKLYFAQKGKGAYLEENGRVEKIGVSDKKEFSEMNFLFSRNHLLETEVKLNGKLKTKGSVIIGSAGIKIASIAEGKGDIYLNSSDKLCFWDTCAGEIILCEAGGKTTDIMGRPLNYGKNNFWHMDGCLVTNGKKHEEIIKTIKELG